MTCGRIGIKIDIPQVCAENSLPDLKVDLHKNYAIIRGI